MASAFLAQLQPNIKGTLNIYRINLIVQVSATFYLACLFAYSEELVLSIIKSKINKMK